MEAQTQTEQPLTPRPAVWNDKKVSERVMRAAGELLARRQARNSLIEYSQFTLPRYAPAWFHRVIADLLEQLCLGGIKRLMIFAPPRHGKSELVSIRNTAFYLGHHPDHSVIGCSYAQELADTWSRATRNVISSPNHQRLWPNKFLDEGERRWTLEAKSSNAAELLGGDVKAGDERPSYISAGVGGPITGHGCDLLNIDDPYKNYEEANSVVNREKVWNWYITTARTRLTSKGAVIITQTRWHEDDLAGRLIRLAKEDKQADQWVILELPAINDDGLEAKLWSTDNSLQEKVFQTYEALWADNYTRYYLEQTKATAGPRQFSALYQQKPQPASGNIIRREWFKRWWVTKEWADKNKIPTDGSTLQPGYAFDGCVIINPKELDQVCQSWDLPFKDKVTSDFAAGQVWGRKGANFILLDRVCERLNFPDTKNKIRALTAKWSVAAKDHPKYIEDKANGPAIIDELKDEISGMIAVSPMGDKTQRLSAASVDAEAGNVILPWPGMYLDIYDFIECLCVFPSGVHDDDCDSFSQALYKLKTSGSGLFDWYKEQYDSLTKNLDSKVISIISQDEIAEYDKNEAFPASFYQKASKVKVKPTLQHCPNDNSPLSIYSDGRWKCATCLAEGVHMEIVRQGVFDENTRSIRLVD